MYTDKLFTGQREITGLGIYHYGARFYSQKLGRFLSADTVVPGVSNPQALNRYSYVLGNPLRYTDPTGHICVNNNGTDDEVSMSGDCHGGENPHYTGGLVGSPSGWEPEDDEPDNTQPSAVATMAMVLDTAAMALNGGYALVGDLIFIVCQGCYPAVVGTYHFYSYIPNTISTVAMVLWIMDGVETGENNLTVTQTSQGTTVSFSVSQDTLVAVGTNIAGWTLLKEPNAAFAVDAAVAGYDLGRFGAIPFIDFVIPARINPTITYNTNTGWDFSWQQK
jgi:RHS repeat-associated protein